MPVVRHFLGWERPLVEAVRDFVIPEPPSEPVDLEADLIVVPTAQAGRRLTDALALYCGQAGTVLLSCHAVNPAHLLQEEPGSAPTAGPLDVQASWIDVLCQQDFASLPGLFPSPPAETDADWALRFGTTIDALRKDLVEAGLTIADLVTTRPDDLVELDRWQDLARLEAAYLERLRRAGLRDPWLQQLAAADAPMLDDTIRRIIVAGVPDPTEPARRVLENLSETLDIDILIAAPESHCDAFDEWGRPRRATWCAHHVTFKDPDNHLVLAASPVDQAEKTVELLQGAATSGGQTVALGAPAPALIPHLQSVLERHGRSAFDPSDKPLREHPLFHLVEAYVNLATDHSYAALACLLRQPELLAHVAHETPGNVANLLQQLDELQNKHIPWDYKAVQRRLEPSDHYEALKQAIEGIAAHLDTNGATLSGRVRAFLQSVLEHRTVTAGEPADDEFELAARKIDEVLHELAAVETRAALPLRSAALLFLRRLSAQRYHRERPTDAIDLNGWLELPWLPAPALIVTGFTDDVVPGAAGDNAFLTDSLRHTLGMRCDADIMARDTFLLQILVESRRAAGALWLISGKVSDSGDPLRPSRLLLRCPDDALPARARHLFREVDEHRRRPAATTSFRLDPAPPPDLPPERHSPTSISVTAFRDYLACPFRFYLRRVLRMEALDDHKRAPDALDFGIMVHDALERMGQNPEMRSTTDTRLLATFLTEQAARWVKHRYGVAPALPIRMALHAAQQRLEAAAHVQADLAADGWEIIEAEQDFEYDLGGLTVHGKIDRIDRHRDSGALRVVDYKTTDGSKKPTDSHLAAQRPDTPEFAQINVAGKAKRWTDLQLPLYAVLGVAPSETPPEPAYFNLPRAVTETALLPWPTFDAELAASAFECAEAIAEKIRAAVFWPPAERVDYDDFESLFHDGVEGWKEMES